MISMKSQMEDLMRKRPIWKRVRLVKALIKRSRDKKDYELFIYIYKTAVHMALS